jgi:hypothetical protein
VGCTRLIAASFQKCSFCGADQPAPEPPAAKETRCSTCKRPYSSKLSECPFCARDRAAGVEPAAFGATLVPRSLRPSPMRNHERDDDDGDVRFFSSAALFGFPVAIGAIWGVAQIFYTTSLGGQETSGVMGPSIVVALFVAPLLAMGFVRRSYRTLNAAIESAGLSKVLVIGFAASAVALIPAALSVAGFIHWLNGVGADSRVQIVECKVGSVWRRMRKGVDMGWQMSYSCDVDGEHLIGTVGPLRTRPDVVEGGGVRFRAARGRVGYWIRLGEPMAPSAPPPLP